MRHSFSKGTHQAFKSKATNLKQHKKHLCVGKHEGCFYVVNSRLFYATFDRYEPPSFLHSGKRSQVFFFSRCRSITVSNAVPVIHFFPDGEQRMKPPHDLHQPLPPFHITLIKRIGEVISSNCPPIAGDERITESFESQSTSGMTHSE